MGQEVFAYGSNMCSGRLRDYCVVPVARGRSASLQGYRVRFNKMSQKDGSGKANVEPHPGGDVWGVLYMIPDAHLKRLDDGEGPGYQRKRLPVRTPGNAMIEAWVYLARKPTNDPTLRPYTWYKRFLIEGAREHGLPAPYIEALERIEADQDKDQQRDLEKRLLACRA